LSDLNQIKRDGSYANQLKLIVVIPAYNEETNIISLLKLMPNNIDEIVIINDGSKDKTDIKIKAFLNVSKLNISYIIHSSNKGKGAAVQTGLTHIYKKSIISSKFNILIFMDADMQMHPKHIKKFVKKLLENPNSFIKGTRFLKISHYSKMPKFRLFGNMVLKYLNRIALGSWRITDPQNGYCCISSHTLSKLDFNKIDRDYFFENSLLSQLTKNKIPIRELSLPSIYDVGEVSSIKYHSFIPKTSFKLLQLWFKRIYSSKSYNIYDSFRLISHIIGSMLFLIFIINLFLFPKTSINSLIFSIIFFLLSIISDYKSYISFDNQ